MIECAATVRLGSRDRLVAATEDRVVLFDAELRTCVPIADGTATQVLPLQEPGSFAALRPEVAVDVFRLSDREG
jgi:hypothetical protein